LGICVFIAATGVIAAATHANVLHAGGYASRDAPLVIALAVLLALGMAFVGVCWNGRRRLEAVLLFACLLCGEAYWLLTNVEREIAARAQAEAPARQAIEDYAAAEQRVSAAHAALEVAKTTAGAAQRISPRLQAALDAKTKADQAVIDKSAEMGCRRECRLMLEGQAAAAQREVAAARAEMEKTDRHTADEVEAAQGALTAAQAALDALPRPPEAAPLPSRIGMPSWLWDLVMGSLRSVAVVGASLAIGMAWHPWRSGQTTAEAPAAPVPRAIDAGPAVEILPPINKREHVSHFLRSVLRPDPEGRASLKRLHERYYGDWSGDARRLPPAELGKELRSIIDALGLQCERSGRDVIVRGAAINT
jgi:hypothetical protein